MPTYTAPTTRSTGALITASIYNTDLVENLKYFKDAPAFAGAVSVGGALSITGALSGVTTLATSSTINGQTISSAANFTNTVGIAGLLTVSGFGIHDFNSSGTGANEIFVRNTTSGAANYANIQAIAGNSSAMLTAYSQGWVTSTFQVSGGGLLRSSGVGGLSIAATNASGEIRFYSGGSVLRWTIDTSGNLNATGTPALNIGGGSFQSTSAAPVYIPSIGASTGTALLVDAGGDMRKLTSAARFKDIGADWVVTRTDLAEFLAVSPKPWNYKGERNGAFGLIADDLALMSMRNQYGLSPLTNYAADGQVESNRDYALIGMQHLVLQQHESRLAALEAQLKETA